MTREFLLLSFYALFTSNYACLACYPFPSNSGDWLAHEEVLGFNCRDGRFRAQTNDYDKLPLHAAVENGNIDVAKKLIEAGCNVNQKMDFLAVLL